MLLIEHHPLKRTPLVQSLHTTWSRCVLSSILLSFTMLTACGKAFITSTLLKQNSTAKVFFKFNANYTQAHLLELLGSTNSP